MENDYRRNEIEAAAGSRALTQDMERTFMTRVYNWMAGGLAITALTAWYTANSPEMQRLILRSPGLLIVLILAEFGLVIALSWAIKKLSPMAAAVCFLVYSLLSGLTLAPIFLVYTHSSIFAAFITCAGMFGATSLFGYLTKRNLAGIGSFCFMGLIGIIIASIVNWFLRSPGLDLILSYLGVAIFLGLTAWDTQKLRSLAAGLDEETLNSADFRKYAIVGALQLYLDFINLFLFLLRIFNRRD